MCVDYVRLDLFPTPKVQTHILLRHEMSVEMCEHKTEQSISVIVEGISIVWNFDRKPTTSLVNRR